MKDKSNPLTIKNGVVIECRKNTTEVIIPEGVTAIGCSAFLGCASLKSVEIPKSVRRIGSSVFFRCNALVEVRYGGTKAQWARITGLYQNEELLDAPVLCKDGTVRLEERTDGFLAVGSIACGHRDRGAVALKIPADITAIGRKAFENYTSLKTLVIPDGVTGIGGLAFGGCTALKSVTIPDSVRKIEIGAFEHCRSLESVVIPDGVREIGDTAFNFCESLKSVEIPKSVRRIGSLVFFRCNALVEVRYGGTKAQWARITGLYQNEELLNAPVLCKDGTVRLEERTDGFLAVGSIACGHRNTGAVALKIPADITAIGSKAFENYTSLKTLVIPDGVTGIGGLAFGGCTALKSVTIPDSVKEIDNGAFEHCRSLAELRYGGSRAQWESVTKIIENWHRDTPAHCVKCADGDVPLPLYIVKDGVLENWLRTSAEAVIPKGVTKIGEYAFVSCTSLEGVVIPDGVREIDDIAFFNCTSLKSVVIPDSVRKIGDSAFFNCASLAEIRFGGTMAQWDAVEKVASWHLYTPEIHVKCADGEASLPPCNSEKGVLKRQYPTGSEMVIIKGVLEIIDFAFGGESLVSVMYHGVMESEMPTFPSRWSLPQEMMSKNLVTGGGTFYHGFALTNAAKRGISGFMLPQEQPFGFSVKTSESALREKIKASDCLISDETCTRRLVGLRYNPECMAAPEISAICTRYEMPLAKQIAFEMGKKLYARHELSAVLFKNYCCGEQIAPEFYRATSEIYARLYHNGCWNRNIPAKVVHCADGNVPL